jgi:hypothetical protein
VHVHIICGGIILGKEGKFQVVTGSLDISFHYATIGQPKVIDAQYRMHVLDKSKAKALKTKCIANPSCHG